MKSVDGAEEETFTCLRGSDIYTFDENYTIFSDGELWFKDRNIIFVGERGCFEPGKAKVNYHDNPGCMVIPGLINAHSHSYSALLKGTVESEPLDIYMLNVIAAGAAMTPRDIFVSAQLDALAMLKTGITATIDHFSERPVLSIDGLNSACDAFRGIGIRAIVATMFADLPYVDTIPVNKDKLPRGVVQNRSKLSAAELKNYFEIMETAVSSTSPIARVKAILGVDGPQRCSDQLLEMTGDFQRRHQCGIHTHMLETKTQAVMRPEGGLGFVRRMLDLGILNEKSSLVHFVWANDDDISAALDAGITVVHSPLSNAMLGAGVAPISKIRQAGIPVAYGTDGTNCGPPALYESMRLGSYLMRLTEVDFEKWPDAKTILREGYFAGAKAMGCAGKIGFLKKGAFADFSVINPERFWHKPMGNPYRHLLYYENGNSTKQVWVNGMQVVCDGKVITVDEDALIEEADEIVHRRLRDTPDNVLQTVADQYPAFREMVLENFDRDIGINRRITLK